VGALSGAGVGAGEEAVSVDAGAVAAVVSGSGKVKGGRLSSTVGAGAAMPDDSLVTRPSFLRRVTNAVSATATVAAAVMIAARA
jgi:hypothetical protein